MRDASDDVWEEADVVHSVKMVVLCAMHELCTEFAGQHCQNCAKDTSWSPTREAAWLESKKTPC